MVFQKISIPPTEGNGNCSGRGWSKRRQFLRRCGGGGGGGVSYGELFPGAPSKIGELSKLSVI